MSLWSHRIEPANFELSELYDRDVQSFTLFDMGGMMAPKMFLTAVPKR